MEAATPLPGMPLTLARAEAGSLSWLQLEGVVLAVRRLDLERREQWGGLFDLPEFPEPDS